MASRALIPLAAALAVAFVPMPSAWVERYYSRRFYAVVQPILTAGTDAVPMAVFDILIVAVLVATVVGAVRVCRAVRGRRVRALGRAVRHAVTGGAYAYLVFILLWGLNYRREPVTGRVDYDDRRVVAPAVDRLAVETIRALNALHGPPLELAAMLTDLDAAFRRAERMLGPGPETRSGRPKASWFGWYFRWAGVDGMVNPFGLEVLVHPDLVPAEVPFTVAHEWGHLAGYAREGEASFLAWRTCRQGSPAVQYSGWLGLYPHVIGALPRERQRALVADLADGPRADLEAIARRLRRAKPRLRAASWEAYDRFLKANRVPGGVGDYDELVRLVVGTS